MTVIGLFLCVASDLLRRLIVTEDVEVTAYVVLLSLLYST